MLSELSELSELSDLSEMSGLSEKAGEAGFPAAAGAAGKPFTIATDEEIRESFRQARLLAKLTEAKREFTAGDYIKAAVLAERHGADELLAEEFRAVGAKANLRLARRAKEAGERELAADYAKKAKLLSGKGVYADKEVKTAAMLILDDITMDNGQ